MQITTEHSAKRVWPRFPFKEFIILTLEKVTMTDFVVVALEPEWLTRV